LPSSTFRSISFFFRQRVLQNALLHSGQYKEALGQLLQWLALVEPKLTNEEEKCYGDIDTVLVGHSIKNDYVHFSFHVYREI
jgi:hypothetical protein